MIPQYTSAALVSENKVLAHPASVDSIPTSANQEDHVSMGMYASRKGRMILDNVCRVVGIEVMTACQGLEFSKPLRPGRGTRAAYEALRDRVPFVREDAFLSPLMHEALAMVSEGTLLRAVEGAVGDLA